MEDNAMNIDIGVKADVAGAEATIGALKKVEERVAKLKAASQDAVAQCKAFDDSLKSNGVAAEETGKKLGFMGIKGEKLKSIVGKLNDSFPAAGMAARAMMNPIGFALTSAIGLFTLAKSKLDAWNAAMDEAQKRNEQRDFLPGLEAKKASLQGLAAQMASYQVNLGAVVAKQDAYATALERTARLQEELASVMAEVNNSKEALDLALITEGERSGKMTKVQAITAREAVRKRYRGEEDKAKADAEERALENKRKALAHAEALSKSLPDEVARKQMAAGAAEARAAQLGRDKLGPEAAAAERERLLKAKEEIRAEYDYQTKNPLLMLGAVGGDQAAVDREKKRLEGLLEKADADIVRFDTNQSKTQAELDKLTTEVPKLKVEAQVAESKLQKAVTDVAALRVEVDTMVESNKIRKAGRAAAVENREAAAGVEFRGAVDSVSAAASAGEFFAGLKGGNKVLDFSKPGMAEQVQAAIAYATKAQGVLPTAPGQTAPSLDRSGSILGSELSSSLSRTLAEAGRPGSKVKLTETEASQIRTLINLVNVTSGLQSKFLGAAEKNAFDVENLTRVVQRLEEETKRRLRTNGGG